MLEWIWQHVKDIGAAVGIVGVLATLCLTILNRRDMLRDKSAERTRKKPFARLQLDPPRPDGWRRGKLLFHNPSGEALEAEAVAIVGDAEARITLHAPRLDEAAPRGPDIAAAASSRSVSWWIGLPASPSSLLFVSEEEIWLNLPARNAGKSSSRSSRIVVTAKAMSASARQIKIDVPITTTA